MKVAVLGAGQVPFTGPSPLAMGALGASAARAAIADAGLQVKDMQIATVGTVYEHPSAGQRVLLHLGLNGIPLVNLESACASGTSAAIETMRWIQAGVVDVALVVGVDKMASYYTSGPINLVNEADVFGAQGFTVPAYFGLIAEKHMADFGSTREDFAAIAHKNRGYAALNPNARFQQAPSMEEVLACPIIASPIGRFDCCANGDGAAAVVLASETFVARSGARQPVWIRAAELGGGVLGDRLFDDPMTHLANKAYAASGLGPKDIQVVECHDNFSVGEFEAYERLGFCAHGEAHLYLRAGKSRIGGNGAAFNPSGGLLGRSHPAGATGCVQIQSVVQQLRGQAGKLQHANARVGLVQTSGGGVMELQSNATTVMIFSL